MNLIILTFGCINSHIVHNSQEYLMHNSVECLGAKALIDSLLVMFTLMDDLCYGKCMNRFNKNWIFHYYC